LVTDEVLDLRLTSHPRREESSPARIPYVRTRNSVILAALLLLVGAALAFLIAANGPSKAIPYGSGNLLDRLAASIGHALGGGVVESATGSKEEVPQAGTWALSLGVATMFLAGSIYALTQSKLKEDERG
jgi:hypothetical protein